MVVAEVDAWVNEAERHRRAYSALLLFPASFRAFFFDPCYIGPDAHEFQKTRDGCAAATGSTTSAGGLPTFRRGDLL
jgi:hypothetical protein